MDFKMKTRGSEAPGKSPVFIARYCPYQDFTNKKAAEAILTLVNLPLLSRFSVFSKGM
jgi:hypothetical protein